MDVSKNLTSSESRICDGDMPNDLMNQTKLSILSLAKQCSSS
ncbi:MULTISPECIES: hypothetical protein [Bacillaceae]